MSNISTSVMIHFYREEKLKIETEEDGKTLDKNVVRIRFGPDVTVWLTENQLQDLQNRIEEVLERLERNQSNDA